MYAIKEEEVEEEVEEVVEEEVVEEEEEEEEETDIRIKIVPRCGPESKRSDRAQKAFCSVQELHGLFPGEVFRVDLVVEPRVHACVLGNALLASGPLHQQGYKANQK